MSNIAIQGAATGTGVFTLASPATNTDRLLTLPDEAGTVLTTESNIRAQAMNGPAFSAYASSNQSISANTGTKILFDVELFDTNSNFASSRFTPTVAGYYQLVAGVSALTASTSYPWFVAIHKNGGQTLVSGYVYPLGTGVLQVSGLIYLNGTTDYVEIYAYQGSISQTTFGRNDQTYFQGFLARAA